jgi:CRP/FNR family cyclic AMP-dependent transcriptional regulator
VSTRDLLAGVALLAGASDDDLDRVAGWTEEAWFASGDHLLRAGEPADRLHVIVEGRVALSIHAPGRGDLVVETLGPGDVLGVSWALPYERWDLDARALTDVATLAIDAAPLRSVMDAEDPLGRVVRLGITGLLGERLHATRIRLIDLYQGGAGE